MIFDANDARHGVNGTRRENLPWEQLGDTTPSLATASGADADRDAA